MHILLSAFAFLPNTGSETGVGWRWAIELAKNHDVTVVTDESRRSLIEAAKMDFPVSLRIVYFRPGWLSSIPLNSVTAQLLYTAWQFALLPFARELHKNKSFDLAVHITYGVFRHPSFLGYIGVPFVFGPVGGGEDAPLALKKSIKGREKAKELVRSLINKLALIDPFLWVAYAGSDLILAKTVDTKRALPWPFRKRAVVYPEVGIDAREKFVPNVRAKGEPLKILFTGRLLGWKGAHLAILSVAKAMKSGVPIQFTLLGRGPYEDRLRLVAREVGIHDQIKWVSAVSQAELFLLYRTMHCFLFPSLHDSSGNVVLEAQANGLPVICLDLGGPPMLVSDKSSIVIDTSNVSEDVVVGRLSDAIARMWKDEGFRHGMGVSAIDHASSMSWASRVDGVLKMAENLRVSR